MKDFSTLTTEEIENTKEVGIAGNYKKVNAPFGYFGSKNKIASKFCRELPPHNCWVEAFGGSAALTLAKPPALIEVINDIDEEIVNLFEQLRNNPEEIYRLVSLTPYSKLELEKARIFNENDNSLERARKFLVKAMFAVNGVFGKEKGGFSYSQSYSRNGKDARVNRWYNLPDRLVKVVERLRSVRIENRDGVELLKMFINRPATLVYLDPPYLGKRTAGYTNDTNDNEYHLNLLKIADKAKCMVFISGYENDLYNDFLSECKGWKRKTIDTITKDVKGKSYSRSEEIWMNKYYLKALKSGKVPIKLSDKEKKQNKINPERNI